MSVVTLTFQSIVYILFKLLENDTRYKNVFQMTFQI